MTIYLEKQTLTPEREVVIHDFDVVHYDQNVFNHFYGDVYKFYALAKLRTARALIPSMTWSDEKIIEESKESYLKFKDGLKVFIDFAIANGQGSNETEFRRDFHVFYHKAALELALQTHGEYFAPSPSINSLFQSLAPHVRHGLLTMSCAQNWAIPLLDKMGRLPYFDENTLLGMEESRWLNKKDSTVPLELAMESMNVRPEQTVFIEDTPENLAKAKELDERILTVYVCPNPDTSHIPDFVDIRVENLHEFLKLAQTVFVPQAVPRADYVPMI